MGVLIKENTETEISLTPELLAKAFWGMGSDEQARFFHALHGEVTADAENPDGGWRLYGLGEMQWCYMAGDLSPEGRQMYMALSAFAYRYWPQREISEIPKALAGGSE